MMSGLFLSRGHFFPAPGKWLQIAVLAVFLAMLAACSSPGKVLVEVGKAALGIKSEEAAKDEVKLTIYAGVNLNENERVPMSAFGRVYYLKSIDAWAGLGASQLMSEDSEKLLGGSLVGSHEIVLSPGATISNKEKVPPEAAYIGVAVFFYSASPARWKYAFDVKEVAATGIVMGAHACALTVSTGKIVPLPNVASHDPASLAFVKCIPPQ